MEGFTLKEGKYNNENIKEEDIWGHFNYLFSTKSKATTTYKYCFIKTLLENLFNVDDTLMLTFDDLFYKFTEVYWNLIVRHKYTQINTEHKKSKIELIIEEFCLEYRICDSISFDVLKEESKELLIRQVSRACSRYVIGAIYADSKGTFFSFSKKQKFIQFNPSVYFFLKKFKNILSKLNYYEWAKFLEMANHYKQPTNLLTKLDEASKRESLILYKHILLDTLGQSKCFYCETDLRKTNVRIEVDHCIPWVFVKDDKLWNLVLCCKNCNNSKSSKLANEIYINKIIIRNLALLTKKNLSNTIDNEFKNYNDNKIYEMYESAVLNGFQVGWKPSI